MRMKTIKELLSAKGDGPVYSVGPEATVFDAVTSMVEHRVGAMLVKDGDTISGIVTERDYLRFITVKGRTAHDTPVREIMTPRVIYVTPETELNEVMAIMTAQRIRHVPVMDNDRLLGIVSIGDVVKQISQDQKVQIRTLEEYISDVYPGPAPHGD
jgi:CBS domain-containing protein